MKLRSSLWAGVTTLFVLWTWVFLYSEIPGALESVTAIVGATVVHPERQGAAALDPDATVIISGDRIQAIGSEKSTPIPRGAKIISAKGKWIIPGMIDSHVHFFQSGNLYTRPDAADFNKWMPYAKEVARNKARLPATFKVWIASGVTSVADVGGPFWNFDVRDLARKTQAAPRVAIAGPLISMVDRPQLDLGDPPIIKVTSADEARALVKRELDRKPDYIKVWFINRKGDDLAAQEAIVKATGDAAHAAGVRLAVHATELDVAKAALRAGADVLVHSVADKPVDEEFISLAKKNRALYTPTLFVRMGYELAFSNTWKPTEAELRFADPQILSAMGDLAKIPKELLPPRVAQLLNPKPATSPTPAAKEGPSAKAEQLTEKRPAPRPSPASMENLRKVWDAGIPVAMGTDAGNIGTLHGPSVFREMELMVKAGLSPQQVLLSATVNGAKMMGMESDLGTIEVGKLADLVILEADPLVNTTNLSKIFRTIKGGVVFEPKQLIDSIR